MPTQPTGKDTDTSKPDNQILYRQSGNANAISLPSAGAAFSEGIRTPPRRPNGPENANTEPEKSAPPVFRFLTAAGSLDSHILVFKDGRRNRSPRAGTPYDTITWEEICQLVQTPAARRKQNAHLFIPSNYAGYDGRSHAAQREHGVFGCLAVDIDTGNPSLIDVAAAVKGAIGGVRAEFYSSSSATADNRKWRVLLPLATPVAGIDYHDTQIALFALLARRGIKADVTLARGGQPVFLPNVPPSRRDRDGRPFFYERYHAAGALLRLDAAHPIVAERERIRHERAAESEAAARRAEEYKARKLAHAQATGDDFEPIAHFKANHTVAELLARYGFERREGGRGSHWKSPLSKSGSYSTEDRGDHWVAVSAWAKDHNVGRETSRNFRSGDAFDLFAFFEHGNDRSAAVRAYAAEVRPPRPPEPAAKKVLSPDDTTFDEPAALVVAEPIKPLRVEAAEREHVVEVDELRQVVDAQLAELATTKPRLAIVTAGMASSKTTTAARVLPGTFDTLVFSASTHNAATQLLTILDGFGHHDARACPPRDETTCRNFTDEDAERLRAGENSAPPISMERAMRVGQPLLACFSCPLFKQEASAEEVDADDGIYEEFAAWDPDSEAIGAALFSPDIIRTSETGAGNAADYFTPPAPTTATDHACEYWRRHAEFKAARIRVQCQERTRRNPGELEQDLKHGTVGVVSDENAAPVLNHKDELLPEHVETVADALAEAIASAAERYKKARRREAADDWRTTLKWAEICKHVAIHLAGHMRELAAGNAVGVHHVPPPPPLPEITIAGKKRPATWLSEVPKNATKRLGRFMATADTCKRLSDKDTVALELVRTLATRATENPLVPNVDMTVLVTPSHVAGAGHSMIVWRRPLRLPYGVSHICLDGTADREAIEATHPHAIFLTPPGVAERRVDVQHWFAEINKKTAPATVVEWIERALEARPGWKATRLFLPKRHRELLFPTTRPRRGATPIAKPIDVEKLAAWGGRPASDDAWQRRLAEARRLAARVEAITPRLAKDANGTPLVDHLRGATARGSNAIVDGSADSLLIVGHVRVNAEAVAAYLVATGRQEAVAAGMGEWGWCDHEWQDDAGQTHTVRFRGYADPTWAGAARALNRADVLQTVERGRTRMERGGIETLLIAGEPAGLPIETPPERLPPGVRAVVDAVARLTGGEREGASYQSRSVRLCPTTANSAEERSSRLDLLAGSTDGYETVAEGAQLATNATPGAGVSRKQPTGIMRSPILIGSLRDSQQAALIEIAAEVGAPTRTVQLWLADAVERGLLVRSGAARSTRYALAGELEEHDATPADTRRGVLGNVPGPPLPCERLPRLRAPNNRHLLSGCRTLPHSPPTPPAPRVPCTGPILANDTTPPGGKNGALDSGETRDAANGRGARHPAQKRVGGGDRSERRVAGGDAPPENRSRDAGLPPRDGTPPGERRPAHADQDGAVSAIAGTLPEERGSGADSGAPRGDAARPTGPLTTLPANAKRDALRAALLEHGKLYGPCTGPRDELARSMSFVAHLVGATGPPA